jgi:hypothetical protein
MLSFQGFQLAPGADVSFGSQQRKQVLLFLFGMTLIGKDTQKLNEIGKHTGINLLAESSSSATALMPATTC